MAKTGDREEEARASALEIDADSATEPTREPTLSEAARNVASGLRRGALAQVSLMVFAVCIDLPLFALAFWFAQYGGTPTELFDPVVAAINGLLAAGLTTLILISNDGYTSPVMASTGRFASKTLIALVLPLVFFVIAQPDPSASGLIPASLLALSAVFFPTRLGANGFISWAKDANLIARRAVIAGGGEHAENLIRGLAKRPENDITLHGIFDDRDDARSPIQVLGVPKIGSYSDIITFAREAEVDMVIIALPLEAEDRINWLLDALRVLPVEVRLSTFSQDYGFRQKSVDPLLEGLRQSFAPERRLTKRVFDIFFASLALVFLWPVMALAALAVKLDSPGPIFFQQVRHGYNNREIKVLKFRSMYTDQTDATAKQVVTRDDPRVTRVGRVLRKSSVDELPQLFNVLWGDLSLVGPRPHAVHALSSSQERFSQIVDGYSARHRLPPGVTGWAQINGWRGEIDNAEKLQSRIEHDLYYIENWSFWLDLKILFKTPRSLLNTSSAY